MTSEVGLSLDLARGRNTGQDTPRFEPNTSVNLRGIGTVNQSGLAEAAQAAGQSVREIENVGQISGELAQRAIARRETLQALEAEKRLTDAQLRAQQAAQEIQTNASDATEIPRLTLEAFDNISEQTLSDESLSANQRRQLEAGLNRTRGAVGRAALNTQAEIEEQESVFSINQIISNTSRLAFNNPGIEDDLKEQASEQVARFGQGLTEVQRAHFEQEFKNNLTFSAMQGRISSAPQETLEQLNQGLFDERLPDAQTKQELIADAETALRSEQQRRKKRQAEVRKREVSDATLQLLSEADGAVDEQGNPITLEMGDVRQKLAAGQIRASDARTLFNLKNDIHTNAGNPRLAAELTARIAQNKGTENEISIPDILPLATKEGASGTPLSRAELRGLRQQIEDPKIDQINRWIDGPLKNAFTKQDSISGNLIFESPAASQAFFEASNILRQKARELIENGEDPSLLVTRGSGRFVGEELISHFSQGLMARSSREEGGFSLGEAPGDPAFFDSRDQQSLKQSNPSIPDDATLREDLDGPNGGDVWETPDGRLLEEF